MLRVIPPFGIALLVGIPTVGFVWYFLPAAGAGAGRRPWSWRRRRAVVRPAPGPSAGSRQAAARGELSTHVVDLLEGAPELVAFGAADAQLARVAAADAELTRIATATARTAGVGSGLITLLTGLAVWGILLVGVPAVHAGRLQGPLLAVIALIPLAAFEMVTGLPAAAQSLERVRQTRGQGVRRHRCRRRRRRPGGPRPAGPAPVTAFACGGRAPGTARTGPWALDGVDLDLSPGRRVGRRRPERRR